MSSFFDEIAAKLAQLSGVATPEVSRDELNEFNVRDIQAVRVSEGGGGGGGNVPFVGVDPPDSPTDGMLWWDPDDDTPASGAGGVRLVGPFHFDYTDFPANDTIIEIFTPTAGDHIRGRIDVASAVAFNDGGSIDFSFGENPDFNAAAVPDTFWGFVGNFFDPGDPPPDSDRESTDVALFWYISTGLPLKIRAQSVVGDGTAGAMDLYFQIETPVAP